ncbi:hypothetical protein PHJA_000335700 [Phtheirospermum japonicum]|uniref:Uncharacterized protein n=1 Tax=Phtheirospermum japonicum TaxID=374723 RepID=A0A830BAW0_9LAMI|nr:hypothetical protein PHJA_000335700 [Phtheirospermum japonicum]
MDSIVKLGWRGCVLKHNQVLWVVSGRAVGGLHQTKTDWLGRTGENGSPLTNGSLQDGPLGSRAGVFTASLGLSECEVVRSITPNTTVSHRHHYHHRHIRAPLPKIKIFWAKQKRWRRVKCFKNPSKAHLLEDLRDVEIICYWADSNHDLEGLKNVLSSKYAKDSPEFERRVVEIEHHQNLKVDEAVVRGYDNTEAQITVLLKGDSCILMFFSWFSKTCGMLSDACA